MEAFEWTIIGTGIFFIAWIISVTISIIIMTKDPPRPDQTDLIILHILEQPSYAQAIEKSYKDIKGSHLGAYYIDSLRYLLKEDLIKVSPQNITIEGVERRTYETTGKGRGTLKDAHLVLE